LPHPARSASADSSPCQWRSGAGGGSSKFEILSPEAHWNFPFRSTKISSQKRELIPLVRVLGRDKLYKFKRKHPDARGPLNAWEAEVRSAKWGKWADIKGDFPAASWLGNARVVFDIKGSDFRLVVQIHFRLGQVLVERVGTHAEYSKWQLKQGKP